jgi:hypothetical protein
MKIAGLWVGLGIGDISPEIRNLKAFMRRKFSYAKHLADTSLFDEQMVAAVAEMQSRYAAQKRIGAHTPGIINVETKYAMGYLLRPVKPKPVIFTVEGHLSSMWTGPAADTARILEQEGLCRWQPVGAYDNTSLPFKNTPGIAELRRLLADRTLLPPGTPWALCHFSRGAIIGSEVWLNDVLPPTGSLHWRLQSWAGTVSYGSPYREKDVVAEWVPDPPRKGTQGISHRRLSNTPALWKEVARRGDLYSENPDSDAGEHRTAIYLAVQGQVWGHPDSLLNQIVETVQRPLPEMIAMTQAIAGGVMFLGNQTPHQQFDLRPSLEFLRARLGD